MTLREAWIGRLIWLCFDTHTHTHTHTHTYIFPLSLLLSLLLDQSCLSLIDGWMARREADRGREREREGRDKERKIWRKIPNWNDGKEEGRIAFVFLCFFFGGEGGGFGGSGLFIISFFTFT